MPKKVSATFIFNTHLENDDSISFFVPCMTLTICHVFIDLEKVPSQFIWIKFLEYLTS